MQRDHALACMLLGSMTLACGTVGTAHAREARPAQKRPASAFADEPTPTRGDVEVKWGAMWRKARIMERQGEIFRVRYEGRNEFHDEWVTADRIRAIGSTRDIPFAKPTPRGQKPRPTGKPIERQGPGDAGMAGDQQASPGQDEGLDLRPADAAAARTIKLSPDTTWAYRPGGMSEPPKPAKKAVRLTGGTGEFFEKIKALVVSSASGKAAVLHVLAPPGKPQMRRLEWVDLVAGRSLATTRPCADTEPVAVSPDGARLLAGALDLNAGAKGRLDVWSLNGEAVAYEMSFRPGGPAEAAFRDPLWAVFADADHVLTMSGDGQMVLWKVPDVRAVYRLEAFPCVSPALSRDGKYVATEASNRLYIVETLTGRCAGCLPPQARRAGVNAFSPDGRRLANVSQSHLLIWDLDGPKVAMDVAIAPCRSIEWVDDQFLLLDGRRVLDAKTGAVVHDYRRPPTIAASAVLAGRNWYVAEPEPARPGEKRRPAAEVESFDVVTPEIRKAAAAVDIDKVMVVRPGSTLSLQVALDEPPATRTVAESLKKMLEANGVKVQDGQAVRMTATSAPGQTREVRYTFFGRRDPETISVTDQVYTVRVEADGRSIWETGATITAPISLTLKEGQTAAQVVAEHFAKGWQSLEGIAIPRYIPAPQETRKSQGNMPAAGGEPSPPAAIR